ncbi:hypothetical protein Gorai_001148 [Gossypium raimondii]|uniref:Uncharacterized protein n=1 Tax=Gossypium raimondii TaxID=29730 RepID=A0A7J8PGP0_GOSRA|nr:hypothetical protein [Gossypium raimondii]
MEAARNFLSLPPSFSTRTQLKNSVSSLPSSSVGLGNGLYSHVVELGNYCYFQVPEKVVHLYGDIDGWIDR